MSWMGMPAVPRVRKADISNIFIVLGTFICINALPKVINVQRFSFPAVSWLAHGIVLTIQSKLFDFSFRRVVVFNVIITSKISDFKKNVRGHQFLLSASASASLFILYWLIIIVCLSTKKYVIINDKHITNYT